MGNLTSKGFHLLLLLALFSCASTEVQETSKSWKSIAAKNALIAFHPTNDIKAVDRGDFDVFQHKNGLIWVSAFHNPKWPYLYVAVRKENGYTFPLTPEKTSVYSKSIGNIPFIEEDKRFKEKYKTLRYRMALKPLDYHKLKGDTLKIHIDGVTYNFVGREKFLGGPKNSR